MQAQTAVKMTDRILIFDDELGVRDSLGAWLSSEGYQAQTAASPLAALNAVRQQRFGLVVMDYDTAGVNFPLFLDQVRESDPDMAVVVLAPSARLEYDCPQTRSGVRTNHIPLTRPMPTEEENLQAILA